MAVEPDGVGRWGGATGPARKGIGLGRQFPQVGAIGLGKQFGAAGAETAHLAGVEFNDQHANGGIEFRQGEETLIAQAGQNPALRDLDGDLNLGLVLLPPRPRCQDRGALIAAPPRITSLYPRILTTTA